MLSNAGGTRTAIAPPRTDLPAVAKDIPRSRRRTGRPSTPPSQSTDFQLQQGEAVSRSMAPLKRAAQ